MNFLHVVPHHFLVVLNDWQELFSYLLLTTLIPLDWLL